MPRFAVSAHIFVHRDGEILILKRSGGYAGGAWFLPGGAVEFGETPLVAAVREMQEECGIALAAASLTLLDVMTFYPAADVQAHDLIYIAPYPPDAECVLNDEHSAYRWVTPAYYCARFLSEEKARAAGAPEEMLRTTRETRRVAEHARLILERMADDEADRAAISAS